MKKIISKIFSDKKKVKTQNQNFERKKIGQVDGEPEVYTKITNLLNYTKFSGSSYSGVDYLAGYHTIEIDGRTLAGQRKPKQRLEQINFDFKNKSVLDIGSNQGGMLFAISEEIRWGVGLDFDNRMINVANAISLHQKVDNCKFFVHDLDNDPMDLIEDYLPENRVDIVFLLSVCMWVKNWRQLIVFLSKISDHMLFETNGTLLQQEEQATLIKYYYKDVSLIAKNSLDDPGKKQRQLYFCSHPIS